MRIQRSLLSLVWASAIVGCRAPAATADAPQVVLPTLTVRREDRCVVPRAEPSVLTSDVPVGDVGSFRGRVVDAEMNPLPGAQVVLEPGHHGTFVDSAGAFQFEGMSYGRYEITVQRIGFAAARDSVTYPQPGVRVVAILTRRSLGDYECVMPTPRP